MRNQTSNEKHKPDKARPGKAGRGSAGSGAAGPGKAGQGKAGGYEWLSPGQGIRCPSGRILKGLDEICTELTSVLHVPFVHEEPTWQPLLKYKDGRRWKTKALNMPKVVKWLNTGEIQ